MKQRLFITGGAGYVGSMTCKYLSQLGYDIIVLDNLAKGHRAFLKWGTFEEADITHQDHLRTLMQKWQPQAVLHFAAWTDVAESVCLPSKYYQNNVFGTLNLLNVMKENGVMALIFSSTCSTYGLPQRIPMEEGDPQNPINPYGETKLIIERMLKFYEKAHGIQSVSLRYFNAAGADPEGEVGEAHQPETHLIPLILEVALGVRPHITIFGNDYPTQDGTCIRDYIHVSDLAQAHIQALEYLLQGGKSIALNLGSDRGYSVRQVIDIARKITQRPINEKIGSKRAGDVPVLYSNSQKAREILSWRPQYEEIEVVMSHAWAWHQKQLSHGK